MHQFSVLLPDKMVKAIDDLVDKKLYSSRGECIRIAIHDMLMEHKGFGHFLNSPKLQKRLRQLEATV
jgi:Predicted transcriptional regulators containing the CopG/Arc/MetJ DNA-binding domain and a metal-binding domain